MASNVQEVAVDATTRTGSIVAGKYRLIKKMGSGSFGQIWLGVNVYNNEEVAIKLESTKSSHPQLKYENRVYQLLQGKRGFPHIRWFGKAGEHNVLVMDLLGPSLEDLLNFCGRRFSLKTVLMLVDQMIALVADLHSKNYVHRDLKPDNFLMGIGKTSKQLFMIDFGLVKKYRDSQTNQHIACTGDKRLIGTARYASINAHNGFQQSRRDDLESIGYVLLYLLNGSLPWQKINHSVKKVKYEKIGEMKTALTVEKLCKGHPAEFVQYFNYCKGLKYEEVPDYLFLRELFRILFRAMNFCYDFKYDWDILIDKCKAEASKKKNQQSSSMNHKNATTTAASSSSSQAKDKNVSAAAAAVAAAAAAAASVNLPPGGLVVYSNTASENVID